MNMKMDIRYQVKQYVAEIKLETTSFRVFKTGDERFFLFAQVNPKTECDTGLQIPVEKSRLKRDILRALNNGWGYHQTIKH